MRILLIAFAISFTTGLYAQVKSGKIVYQMHTESNPEYAYGPEASTRFVIRFNEHFIWYGKENHEDDHTTWTLEDKTTQLKTSCYTDDGNKCVQFYIEEPLEDYPEDSYYDEEEPKLDNYHENYYKDLMKFKAPEKDTVIERTDETKEILGFMCRKSILKIKDRETITVWYTREIVGLENILNLASWVDGTILSYTSEDVYGSYHLDADELDKTSQLNEKELFTLPKGYSLRLRTVYLRYPEYSEPRIEQQLDIQPFITVQDPAETIHKITSRMDQSVHFDPNDLTPLYLKVIVTFDEKGAVSFVKFYDDYDDLAPKEPRLDEEQLFKEIKKNCSMSQPATLNGKPVPLSIKIDYSYYVE